MTGVATTIESVILAQDRRNIGLLRPHLPQDYCTQAARFILAHRGPAIVATGFYIAAAGLPETDGPPGAVAIGRALQALGYPVVYVTDDYVVPLLAGEEERGARVVAFPQAPPPESRAFAARLLEEVQPALCIAIERPGLSALDDYRNMRGRDVSARTARVDELFLQHPCTVGVGDGGNEIGMGNLYEVLCGLPQVVPYPATTRVSRLVIASVSNWGGQGLVAALSLLAGRNLLPSEEEEAALVERMVAVGAVDGVTGERAPIVDTFPLDEYLSCLRALHALLRGRGVA